MIDVQAIRRLNNYDTDAMIRVLELNEDRLYAWLVQGTVTVVREDLDGSIEYVKPLLKTVRPERSDYVSPYEAELPFLIHGLVRELDFNLPYVRHVPNQGRDRWMKSDMISTIRLIWSDD